MLGVNSRVKRGVMQHYISDSIYGLTLAWITSENSTKQLECRHLDSIFFAGPYLMLARLSAPGVWSRLPLSMSRRQLLSSVSRRQLLSSGSRRQLLSAPLSNQLSSRVPLPFPDPPRFQVQNPLSGFAPKQTKESSAWWATYIVLQPIMPWGLFQPCKGCSCHILSSDNRPSELWSIFKEN